MTQLRILAARRLVTILALGFAATGCEQIFGEERPAPLRVTVSNEPVYAEFFAAGATVDGVVMPRSGVQLHVPVTLENTSEDSIHFSGCGEYFLIDSKGLPPMGRNCALLDWAGTPSLAPMATRTVSTVITACDGTADEVWSAGYPCYAIWHKEEVHGLYRLGVSHYTQSPRKIESYSATSNRFAIVDSRIGFPLVKANR